MARLSNTTGIDPSSESLTFGFGDAGLGVATAAEGVIVMISSGRPENSTEFIQTILRCKYLLYNQSALCQLSSCSVFSMQSRHVDVCAAVDPALKSAAKADPHAKEFV